MNPLPTIDFLKGQVITKIISRWDIHNCSICGYKGGFIFIIKGEDVEVKYDSGCYCIRMPPSTQNFQQIVDHIGMQTHPVVIEQYKQFWDIK